MEQIIRCENCEYFREWDDGSSPTCLYWTDQWDMGTEPDGFCSFGKLKLGCEVETYELVKHGHWVDINGDSSLFECSICGNQCCCEGNYCSECEAKMDERIIYEV